ncbi:hypothetical protein SPRG_01706 [Saprolegnia parasitica CBS 223.65]|uniref:Uncharacterized protein n=1 Tax=Saprolegnia parasitica (strain CBS 223.65) TaxID=695850 RepID=A0A067D479_SAPPC|nr:hypothetical protein SPRG_01706 [Saprolegnia parasitica CBS 223.65]KDO33827.1 hypothetical protein SPRG_01706 [Saprolegnia parasitica CBS 223.65]|eukprot:XP_012195463.1 hypothetical protein SPRG_01706 [Saprolegnia parasitica CBS 223.65]
MAEGAATQQDIVAAMRVHTKKCIDGIQDRHLAQLREIKKVVSQDQENFINAYKAQRALTETATTKAVAAEAHIVELTAKCDGLVAANDNVGAQLAALQLTADELRADADCLQSQLQASEQHVRDLSVRETGVVNANTALQSKIGTLQVQLRTAVSESNEYKKRHDELALTCKGHEDISTQQKSDLVASNVRLKIATAEVQASSEKLKALAAEKDGVIARLQNELAASKADAERAITEAMRKHQSELAAALMELEEVRTPLAANVAAAEASTSLSDLLFVDGDHFAADLQRLEDDLATSKAELAEAAAAAAASKATIDVLSTEKLALAATVQEQKDGLAAMTLQLRESVQRTDASTQQIAALFNEKKRLASVLKRLDEALATSKAELAEAAAASKVTIEALSTEKLALAATLQDKTKALAAMTVQLDKAMACIDADKEQIESLFDEKSRLTSALVVHEAAIEAFNAERDATKAELEQTKAESQQRADTSINMCRNFESEKDEWHLRIAQLSTDLSDAKEQQMEALRGEASRLTSLVAQQEAAIAAATSELADAVTASQLALEAAHQEKTDALAAMTLQLRDAADDKQQQIKVLLAEKDHLTAVIQLHDAASTAELDEMRTQWEDLCATKDATVRQLHADLDVSTTALTLAQVAATASAQQINALAAANRRLQQAYGQLATELATTKAAAKQAQANLDYATATCAMRMEEADARQARLLATIEMLQARVPNQAPMVCDQCARLKALLEQSSTVIASLRADRAAALDQAKPDADIVRAFFARVDAVFPILHSNAIEPLIQGMYQGDTRVFEATDGFTVFPRCLLE